MDAGNNNVFYHNNIITNTIQIVSFNSPNTWDNGSKGNYWSDYNGTDGNGDSIGDTPYVIDENNQDNYPLMSPWTPGHPAPFWIQWWFWLVVTIGIAALVGMHHICKPFMRKLCKKLSEKRRGKKNNSLGIPWNDRVD